jgi:hypothetical protein
MVIAKIIENKTDKGRNSTFLLNLIDFGYILKFHLESE